MRYVPTSLACLLTASAVSLAGPGVVKVDSPPKPDWQVIQCDPVFTALRVEKPGTWELVDDSPAAKLQAIGGDGKVSADAGFAGLPSQQYRVLVTTPDGVFRLKLVTPGPPQPQPSDPDKPKPPTPPPPLPVDPLVQRLQLLYDADTRDAAKKSADRLDLIELYKQAAAVAMKFDVTTTGDLVKQVQAAAKALGIDGLTDVRKAIAAELQAAFPTDELLTSESRAKAATIFGKIKAALEQVK